MDALTALLTGPRASGAFLLRSVFDPPWSLRIEDRAPLTVLTTVRGTGWVVPDGAAPVPLHPGDLVIVRGPEPYTVADLPQTPPQVVIHPGQVSTTVGGERMCEELDQGVRTWGTGRDAATVLLSGTYQLHGEVSGRLLRALPPVLRLDAGEWASALPALLEAEIGRDEPGQDAVLDRLLDLLLISALRSWFAREDGRAPAWYRAHSDPLVGRALGLLHADPARAWTVRDLAAECGVSRAALARRFTDLVGEPPMAYLTGWRLARAADLLAEPDATLSAVARKVGYGSGFALSAAFKRVRGISPQQFRDRSAAAGAGADGRDPADWSPDGRGPGG
ncbi:AraC family transcriptional regulator [Kitasatospora phosalacinea]|uniref:AraC family transcriptional regulator n=1 Tax=Kitasatospora phosalacinea TaxID=2065 RepID=UPI0006925991|nr:AraC family transcriptional regulator [Kitasatospora phosalacinea]